MENVVTGIRGSYGSSWQNNNPNPEYKNFNYSGGLFYRRYFSLSKSFYLFGDAGVDYGKAIFEDNYPAGDINFRETESVGINVFPGITYVAGKHFHLEVLLNTLLNLHYTSDEGKNVSSMSSNSFKNNSLNLNLNVNPVNNITIGFRIVL